MSDESLDAVEAKARALKRSIWESLERARRTHRELYPGSYDPSIGLMLLDPTLNEVDVQLVFAHEHAHFVQGQTHWGEAIRRLNTLQILMSVPLQLQRSLIITRLLRHKFGEKLTAAHFERIAEPEVRKEIRAAFAADDVFMRGLQAVNDAEKRKDALSKQWIRAQEGFAYWACLKLGSESFERRGFAEGMARVKELAAQLPEGLPPAEADGYRLVSGIAESLHGNFSAVNGVLYVCLNVDFTDLPLLDLPLAELEERLASSRYSPDERLKEAAGILRDKTVRLDGSMDKFDADLAAHIPMMTIDAFNDYWRVAVDAHPKVVSLMNDIHAATGGHTYRPITIEPGTGGGSITGMLPVIQSNFSLPDYADSDGPFFDAPVNEEDTTVTSVDVFKRYQQIALTRDSLMRMAKAEGLVE